MAKRLAKIYIYSFTSDFTHMEKSFLCLYYYNMPSLVHALQKNTAFPLQPGLQCHNNAVSTK